MAESRSCELQGKSYPNNGVACIGDQCIQCYDGSWGPNQYELALRERMGIERAGGPDQQSASPAPKSGRKNLRCW